MATGSRISFVTLTEDDIPGAKLTYPVIESHSVIQLKRWLQCRELKCTGNKDELIKRVKACIAAKADKIIPVSVDGGKWYDLKVKQRQQQQTSPREKLCIPPVIGWKAFPSVDLPEHFNFGHIHHHIVESVQHLDNSDSESDGDIEDAHTAKPLKKGKDYFDSGHVQNMQDMHKGDKYFLKSVVLASYEVGVKYHVMIVMSHSSGFVRSASCTCKASAMGRCAHVTAVLIALNDYICKYGTKLVSQTSRPCDWNRGRKKGKNPQNVLNDSCTYGSAKKKKVDSIKDWDPTPGYERSTDESVYDFLAAISNGDQSTMWETLLAIKYDDYSLSQEQERVLKKKVDQMYAVCGGQSGPIELVQEQNSAEWYNERRIRATASISKRIACCKTQASMSNILKSKLWAPNVTTAAMRYGSLNEDNAFNDYEELMKSKNPASRCFKTGFWINGDFPVLGASPDGIVQDESTAITEGLIEIKCPASLAGKPIEMFREHLSKKQLSNFFLRDVNGTFEVKKGHTYYYQIQTQLGILEKSWCDLVVWGSKGNFVTVRVPFDQTCWDTLKKDLLDFHRTWLAPEFFEMRIPRRLLPLKVV